MVERRIELNRRYSRKKKMTKLKARLAAAKDGREREAVLVKIRKVSPGWTEAESKPPKAEGKPAKPEGKAPKAEGKPPKAAAK
jgi:hypothetical protein